MPGRKGVSNFLFDLTDQGSIVIKFNDTYKVNFITFTGQSLKQQHFKDTEETPFRYQVCICIMFTQLLFAWCVCVCALPLYLMNFLLRYKNNWIQVSIILLVECYALLANGSAHAKLEACIYMNATHC